MEPVLQVMRRLGAETTDGQLIERYATLGDQEAFAQLVERHGRLVLGVCRRILHDPHDAEDAFQAVFVLLARKARTLRDPGRLSAWLHGVAVRVAKKAQTLRARQQRRDQCRPAPEARDPTDERLLGELLVILDEQLQSLPTLYRVPLILHHLEGLTQAETARHLSCPPGTVAARLSRGRELLRKLLERRGVAISAGTVASLLARAEAASAGFFLLTLVQGAAGLAGAGAASGAVQTLVNGVTLSMTLERMRRAALTLVLALVCLGGPGWVAVTSGAGYYDPPKIVQPPVLPEAALPPALPEPTPPGVSVIQTANFHVTAPTSRLAELVAKAAEQERADLAKLWLGKELPAWSKPCSIRVTSGPQRENHSTFQFGGGKVVSREMLVGGPTEQVLATALPHEIMHLILADHFGQPVPRWADEGIAQLAEDATSQRETRQRFWQAVTRAGRLPLASWKFLAAREYPKENIGEFYALSHGLVEFLVQRKGRATLLAYVADGLTATDWGPATKKHYGLENVKALEDAWLAFVKKQIPRDEMDASRREKLFPQMPPDLVLACISADAKNISIRRPAYYYEPVTKPEEGGKATTRYVLRTATREQILPVEQVTFRTAAGKELTPEQARDRLKEETLVFWRNTTNELPEAYLKLLREDTLFVILKVPTGEPAPPPEGR